MFGRQTGCAVFHFGSFFTFSLVERAHEETIIVQLLTQPFSQTTQESKIPRWELSSGIQVAPPKLPFRTSFFPMHFCGRWHVFQIDYELVYFPQQTISGLHQKASILSHKPWNLSATIGQNHVGSNHTKAYEKTPNPSCIRPRCSYCPESPTSHSSKQCIRPGHSKFKTCLQNTTHLERMKWIEMAQILSRETFAAILPFKANCCWYWAGQLVLGICPGRCMKAKKTLPPPESPHSLPKSVQGPLGYTWWSVARFLVSRM